MQRDLRQILLTIAGQTTKSPDPFSRGVSYGITTAAAGARMTEAPARMTDHHGTTVGITITGTEPAKLTPGTETYGIWKTLTGQGDWKPNSFMIHLGTNYGRVITITDRLDVTEADRTAFIQGFTDGLDLTAILTKIEAAGEPSLSERAE